MCFVLKKKKSRKLLGYILSRTELSLEIDRIWFLTLPAAFFPLPSSSFLQRAPAPHPGTVVSRLHVERILNRKEPGYRPINQ